MNEICARQCPDDTILETLIADQEVSHLSVRERIELIEDAMFKCEQLHIPVGHAFADGLYMRQIMIPKGTLLTSKFHKYEQLDVMLQGDMSIVTNDGVVRVKAPMIGTSTPGMKRLGYAHEDTLWITVHATKETSIETLEKMLFADSYEEMERFEIERHREDYGQMLIECGFSHETARAQSENTGDQITISLEDHGIKVADSLIEGQGIFAVGGISEGETIAPARISGMRTQAGRFTNHSAAPNAIMTMREGGNIDLVALRNINEEEITVDYRQSLKLSVANVIKEDQPCRE